jgi:DNA polymerase-3 subunit epsilon
MSLLQRLSQLVGRGGSGQGETRWVVVDVETSGLNAHRDRLLAIAGVAVRVDGARPRIDVGDSFEIVLRQDADSSAPDRANILLHGIGVAAQRAGVEPGEALLAFERWVGPSPLVAFHSAFDEAMIQRHFQAMHGRRMANAWADLALVAPVVAPKVRARTLDEWMDAYGIECAVRHQAAADTFATAELMLRLWTAIGAELGGRPIHFGLMQRLAAQARWMPSS